MIRVKIECAHSNICQAYDFGLHSAAEEQSFGGSMEYSAEHPHPRRGIAYTWMRTLLLLIWIAIRLPAVTLLIILEPFVTICLMGFATMGVITCILNYLFLQFPHFPYALMLSISIGSALLLLPYYGLMRFLSRSAWRAESRHP